MNFFLDIIQFFNIFPFLVFFERGILTQNKKTGKLLSQFPGFKNSLDWRIQGKGWEPKISNVLWGSSININILFHIGFSPVNNFQPLTDIRHPLDEKLEIGGCPMTIEIEGYPFEGPYSINEKWRLHNKSGVYAILTKNSSGSYNILDVGESSRVQDRVETHDRKTCWEQNKTSGLYIAVYYCEESLRIRLEQSIRHSYNPPCGEK